jgi:NADH-quinone oxidoreductase subunit N
VASFFILAKVMMVGFAGAEGSGAWRHYAQGWAPVLAVVAALSLVVGNLAAIVQSSVRRLLAYSAIAHAGYMLVGILANQRGDGIASVLYYVTTYALTTVGAFGVVAVVQERAGEDKLSSFAGLGKRQPLLALCMMIFLLSLAGIPPLAGFFGKFLLFKAAIEQGPAYYWLIAVAIIGVVISIYYYFGVVRAIYWSSEPADLSPIPVSLPLKFSLAACILGMLYLGIFPNAFLNFADRAIVWLR